MDETISNGTPSWTYPTSTATTSNCTDTLTLSTLDDSTVWFPYYMESTWLPYHEIKYKPEWHIKKGYKNQLKKMWDD